MGWGYPLGPEGVRRGHHNSIGKQQPCPPRLTESEGMVPSALLCPPSVPQESASVWATSPHLAWLSGTGTPVWRCMLGDREVKASSHGRTDTQTSGTEQRPQKEAHTNMPD